MPEIPLPIDAPADHRTFREIVYREEGQVGYLSFDFYNGAMSTEQCYRLRDAFLHARSRPTNVIVLLGGSDFWSNGIHLNVIEASASPADQSWLNINAINDLIFEIINTMSHLVISGLRGNAGAGGAILALASDHVYAMSSVVLNPHYRSMGELYGSEYWTYLLPRRVGKERAIELTRACKPIGMTAACDMGFIDEALGAEAEAFEAELGIRAQRLAQDPALRMRLRRKHEGRIDDELVKPLASYRMEELAQMRGNFFGPDPAYHEARRRFVFKGNPPQTRSNLPLSVAEIDSPAAMHAERSARRMLRDASLFSPYGESNRSAHPFTHNAGERAADLENEMIARLVKMLRRGVEALPFIRHQ